MYSYDTQLRVRYADTDQMGFVYYGNYATYYEVARVEAFRNLGYVYKKMEESGVMMPVLSMKSQYHYPAKYDDLLTIKVTIPEKPRARIHYHYQIFNEEEKLLNTGETLLVFVNMKTGKPTKMPADLQELLFPFYE